MREKIRSFLEIMREIKKRVKKTARKKEVAEKEH